MREESNNPSLTCGSSTGDQKLLPHALKGVNIVKRGDKTMKVIIR